MSGGSFDFFNQNTAQPGQGGGRPTGPNGEEILVDVKCGRLLVEGKTMKPDDRKGRLRIARATDGLCHLQWGARSDDMPFIPEDDFIIFPQEAVMKFIPKPGCFVVKFPDDASRNMFFWSQEAPGSVTDDSLTSQVNAGLNGEAPEADSEQQQLLAMLSQGGGGGDLRGSSGGG
eukprot:CAMPEP_0197578486 /NCGR_PEP_ID=MMETSP1326-20131121/2677_1 /TAXON_ID=1155430 /ORGANISM="Genus nov. species nov., Strain RCC2288" /LENGTH=173 /DNA_ID=CAMNT_0043141669 /DNA_START=43 /DNA_END=560 /DNA_ORIENTATION=+